MAWVDDSNAALLTDMYELTMASAYRDNDMHERATFDLFVRRLPEERSFLVVCGLEDALDHVERLRFSEDALSWLSTQSIFRRDFVESLRDFRFTGDVWAVPEGEVVFANEPLLRVTAPIVEAQILESFLLNCVLFQTMVASKAARIALACKDSGFVDFSLRRDHGADAALKAARAAFIGGATGTSNLLASRTYGIPPSGTMAHSWVMAHDSEEAAFLQFARSFPYRAILLIDTYDTLEGARRAARVGIRIRSEANQLAGVRLDSGDFLNESKAVRRILDDAGLPEVRIVASGDLDEYRIQELRRAGAPIDAYGVGTQLGTSGDAPSLGGVYKLAEYRGLPRVKLSPEKATLPGRKQVHRFYGDDGYFERDVLSLHGERFSGATPLLQRVMHRGRRVWAPESLMTAKERCRRAIALLPEDLRRIDACATGEVLVSERLRRRFNVAREALARREQVHRLTGWRDSGAPEPAPSP